MSAKVNSNKKVSKETKVKMSQVKPQVTFIKRNLHKFFKEVGVVAETSTTTKPETKGASKEQKQKVGKFLDEKWEEMKQKYPHTTETQETYMKDHFNTHFNKYLK